MSTKRRSSSSIRLCFLVQNLSYEQVLRNFEDENNGPFEEAFAGKTDIEAVKENWIR